MTATRPYNFSAGPATLPAEVLQQAADELLDWHGSGMSVMEMSHRGKEYAEIFAQTESDLRELMGIPKDYTVLFLQGGGAMQFAQVALNFLGKPLAGDSAAPAADYLVSGWWSKKAVIEANRLKNTLGADIALAASSEEQGFCDFPTRITASTKARYVHFCSNETIHGIELHDDHMIPRHAPWVVDMSSNILSRVMDVSRYGMIYAGAQKNIGCAGLTLVILSPQMLELARQAHHPLCPILMQYPAMAQEGSMLNTPATYSIYIAGLVFAWLKKHGGVAEMEKTNRAKAKLLYDTIASSSLYVNTIAAHNRSLMNIPFFLRDDKGTALLTDATAPRNADFLQQSKAAGLLQLKGHKVVGGMRASIYNAMPLAGVQALCYFMREFERHA